MTEPTATAALPLKASSPARDIQKDVHRLKRSIDDTMATGGSIIAQVIRAGRIAKLTAYDTQPALERAMACLSASMEARTASLAAHDELRDLAGRLDFDVLGWGALIESPSFGTLTDDGRETVVPLRPVSNGS